MIEKSFDLVVAETKENLIKVLNASGLPITVMSMILKELTGIVDEESKAIISQKRKEYDILKENLENKENIERNDEDGNK